MKYKQIWQMILQANRVLLVSHIRPDGDALSSILALFEALKNCGKNVSMFNAARVLPMRFSFLPNFSRIKNEVDFSKFDLIITNDCANFQRACVKTNSAKLINIDHHKSNESFADINLVDITKASTTAVIYDLLVQNDIAISADIATCIYVGIVEDTEFFSIGNLDEQTFCTALNLIKCGANPKEIAKKLRYNRALSSIRIRQIIYEKFDLTENGKILSVFVSDEDFKSTNASKEEMKKVANELQSIACVEYVIVIIKEKNGFKVSLRSNTSKSVSTIAEYFGGGGHTHSAGFEVELGDERRIKDEIIIRLKKEGYI